MQRPGPLQELPLERFLPSNPNIPPASVKPIRSNKRPLSPGGPTLFSPAKRRILNDEGIYSPDKTCKSPLPLLTTRLASPARFGRVLAGPANPARILDFGLPKNVEGDPQKPSSSNPLLVEMTPASPSNCLAPSPELKTKNTRPIRNLRSPDFLQDEENEYEDSLSSFSSNPSISPTFVLRELPPQPNPLSIHYPGFSVYQDPHLVVFPMECMENPQPVESCTYKENLPPRRKAGKVVPGSKTADHDVFSSGTMSPRKPSSTKETPKRTRLWSSEELSSTVSRNMFRISSPTNESKKSGRQMMKDEMDIVEEDHNLSDE